MRFGLRLPTYIFPEGTASLDTLIAYAQKAESHGFDSLWVMDHYLIAAPSYRVAYLDPLLVLASVASASNTLRLGTSILQVPLRQPVMLAQQLATLDWLSDGRFDLGIGVGWQKEEFEGAGVSLRERGKRLDEYLEAMVCLWTNETASYHGQFVNFDEITLEPRPVQKPYPPLSFGGGSTVEIIYADDPTYQTPQPNVDRVYRRIGRWASAWQATSTSDPRLLERDWEHIVRYAEEFGRSPGDIERMQTTFLIITEDSAEARECYNRIVGFDFDQFIAQSSYLYGPAEKLVEELKEREEMGISRMILTPVRGELSELDEWAERILSAFK
jgi:alkanesulfonate monooxygenase